MKRKQIQKWIFFVVLICGLANLFGYMTYVHSQSYNAMAVRINGSRTDTDNEPDATQLSAAVFHEERNKYMTNSYDNNDSVNITTKTYVQYKSNAHDNLNSIQHSLKSRSSSNSVTNNNVKPTRSRSVSHRTKIAHFNGVLNTDLGYIHNNIKICNSQLHIDMVIGVTSAVPNIRRRAVIRETWGAYRNAKVKLIFIVGRGNASVQRQIEAESLRHGDVVQRDFRDTYRNLTLKSSALFEWVTHFCNQSSFVLKADDDMFVNIPSLVHKLKEQNKRWGPKFFYCYFLKKSSPFRSKDSKWYTTMQEYKHKLYPPYCIGTAYAMTTATAVDLHDMSKSVPLFWLEDIYWTGILAGKLRIRHLYAPSFSGSTKYPADPCVFRVKDTVHLTDGGVIALKDTWKASRKAHLKCASPRRRNRKAADASVVYVLCIFVLFCALFALALTVAVNADTKIKDKEQHKKRTAERVMK